MATLEDSKDMEATDELKSELTKKGLEMIHAELPHSGFKLTDNVNYYFRVSSMKRSMIERSGQAYFEVLDHWNPKVSSKMKIYKILALNRRKLPICELSFVPKKSLNEKDIVEMLEKVKELSRAISVYMVKYNPDNQILPSPSDKSTAKKIQSYSDKIHLELKDQLIVSNNEFFSFEENGLLAEEK